MITLTNEEYNAIMEAREELALESIQKDVKKNLDKAGHQVHKAQKAVGHEVHKAQKAIGKALGIKKHHKDNGSKDNGSDDYSDGKNYQGGAGSTNGRVRVRPAYLPGKATTKDGKEYEFRASNESVEDVVREAVIDWYEENGFIIDEYEMGRIDSFVESYMEDNDLD